jgi:hypothetical protein
MFCFLYYGLFFYLLYPFGSGCPGEGVFRFISAHLGFGVVMPPFSERVRTCRLYLSNLL